jgi:hypothetical protein
MVDKTNSFTMFDDVSGVQAPTGGSQPWEPPSLLDDELDGVMPNSGGINLSLEAIAKSGEEDEVTPSAQDFEFKNLTNLNPEELHSYLYQMKEHYSKVRAHNKEMDEKLYKQGKREKRMHKDHKQNIFQTDTVAMMTKYQLVFVKMENSFAKVFNSNKLRWLHLK